MTQPPAAPTLHPSPDNCIHGKVCMALNNYLQGVLMSTGNASVIRCLDVMRLGEGCPHYASTPGADARQRIEDVVKELEVRRDKVQTARKVNGSLTGGNLAVHIYNDAIALLKDGVERK